MTSKRLQFSFFHLFIYFLQLFRLIFPNYKAVGGNSIHSIPAPCRAFSWFANLKIAKLVDFFYFIDFEIVLSNIL